MYKLILVIENENNLREMLVDIIDHAGKFIAVGADNGMAALELVTKINFDLITLDIGMSGMDGNVFLAELPKVAPTIPVVVLTAWPEKLRPHPQVKALLEKPFHFSNLLITINTVCTQ
jgi:CheY-like chemotaxis protein